MSLDKLKLLKKAKPFARVAETGTRGLLVWKELLIELASAEEGVCALTLRSAGDLEERANAKISFFDTVMGGVVGDVLHVVTDSDKEGEVIHHAFRLGAAAIEPIHQKSLLGVDKIFQIDERGHLLARTDANTVAVFQLGEQAPAELARLSLEWKNGGSGYMTGAMRANLIVMRGPGDHTGWKILRLEKAALAEIGDIPGSMNQAENLVWLSDVRFAAYGIGKKVRLFEMQGSDCASLGTVDVGARFTACVGDATHLFVYSDYDHRFDKGVLVDISGAKPEKDAAIPLPAGLGNLLVKDGRAYFSDDDLVGVQL